MAPNSNSNLGPRARKFVRFVERPATLVLTFLGLAGAYFAAVEWRVRTITRDPEYLADIARRVRPSLVIDDEGRVLSDTGALSLLEKPPEIVLPAKEDREGYTKIMITPKQYLKAEPIVEALDIGNSSVLVRRGKGISWEVRVGARYQSIVTSYEPKELSSPRYRIELVPSL